MWFTSCEPRLLLLFFACKASCLLASCESVVASLVASVARFSCPSVLWLSGGNKKKRASFLAKFLAFQLSSFAPAAGDAPGAAAGRVCASQEASKLAKQVYARVYARFSCETFGSLREQDRQKNLAKNRLVFF